MATIIKSGRDIETGRDVRAVEFNLVDMSDQAEKYLDDVRQQAAELVAMANREAEEIRQRAETAGREAAMREVEKHIQQQISQQLRTVFPAIGQMVETFEKSQHAWFAQWESGVVKLATAIAARVIRREVRQEPKITLDWVTESLQMIASQRRMTVRLHPEDYAALRNEVKTLATRLRGLAPTEIIADANIERGGCRADTESGTIDHQIESQLNRIEEEILGT